MPSYITYVTKKHFMFVRRTLMYLAVYIIHWQDRGQQGSIREAGRGSVEDGTGCWAMRQWV